MECFILNCREKASIGQKSTNKGGIFGVGEANSIVQLYLPSWGQLWVLCQQAMALPWLIATLILATFSHHFPAIDPWQNFSFGDCNLHIPVQGINAKL